MLVLPQVYKDRNSKLWCQQEQRHNLKENALRYVIIKWRSQVADIHAPSRFREASILNEMKLATGQA